MNFPINNFKIRLRFWALTFVVTLLSFQLTAANIKEAAATSPAVTIKPFSLPTSIQNDMEVLKATTTTATIQLRLHDLNDELENKEKLLTTLFESKDESTYIATTQPSTSTLTPSNDLPAITTNQPREISARQQQPAMDEQKEKSKIYDIKIKKEYKNNDDELEREMEKSDLKLVTESVAQEQEQQQQQQQQPSHTITTEVSWQKETDMPKQATENARNAKHSIKITATIATLEHHTSVSSSAPPYGTTTSTTLTQAMKGKGDNVVATASPVEQNKPDYVQQKEIAGDDVKPANNNEMDAITLTLTKDRAVVEDFKPLIKDVNQKLIKERTIFSTNHEISNEEWKQNLMPNELNYSNKKPTVSKTYEHNINWSPYLHPASPVTDFTGKLLQEQDGVITEIEKKFRLNEFDNTDEAKTTKQPPQTTQIPSLENTPAITFPKKSITQPAPLYSVNHKILAFSRNPILNKSPMEFIERRVKKSFDFPMHRVASDAQHLQQHFDFASTKFNSNNNEQHNIPQPPAANDGLQKEKLQPSRPQPEFSTTKFYNSKELYNELLQHKTKQQEPPHTENAHDKDLQELDNNKVSSLTLNSFAVLHSPKIAKLEEIHETKEFQQQQQQQKSLAIKKVTVKATKHTNTTTNARESSTTSTTTSTTTATPLSIKSTPTKGLSPNTLTEMPLAALVKTKKFQKELKRAQLLIKSMMPLQNLTTSKGSSNKGLQHNTQQENTATILPLPTTKQFPTITSYAATTTAYGRQTTSSIAASLTSPATTAAIPAPAAPKPILPATSTNSPKTSLHPILRPHILSRLQEKINSLECELQNLAQDSHLWRGNETHELLLPIMTPENCKDDKDCTAMMVSWEGESEIQSGDILIVEINDALLIPKDINLTTSPHNTQVYQVTRSGHEHCDVTEGILLDITPLIVDGRKLVTLFDKDLTEGVNLLIVVSELWGAQCVRLKVTTKTENCGESADCSGKGICYSNYDMEEYECQCCSGFAGPHCEEIDACTPSPCTNNGICVDLSQGHEGNSYQCLCPYGYTGKNCQYELDPCNPAECMNGGSCVGNSTHFRCECTPGYTGPLCQHSLNECESSPCIHGICVDQEDGFRCFCQPGFAGELCNFEYNECESNPCQNGGECIDHIGSYECHCSKGYTGNRCQIKVDFCVNKPCPEGRRCVDHGNDYSCECLGGRNGPDCNEMQRTQCNVNPCTHGGTCWSSGESFYCACRPGYTGTMCEDEFVVETVVSSSEFIVDDTSARNFNDKSFGSSVVLKSPIELHNAYTAAIVLALVIFFVALYLIICHCKVNQTYRKFSTRTYSFLPILGFRWRTKQATSKISRHWLSGKGLGIGNVMRSSGGGGATSTSSAATSAALHASVATPSHRNSAGHLPTTRTPTGIQQQQHTHIGQLNERPFQRHLAMNLENDMYYTVDFSENSQHSPLIQ